MPDFIVNKENGFYSLAISVPDAINERYDKKLHKSNYPIRIIKNNFSKIIVAVDSNPTYQQLILCNLDMLDKDIHLTHKYLSDVYYERVNEMISNCPYTNENLGYRIVIIGEDKSFEVYDDGYVKEDDLLPSSGPIAGTNRGLFDSYKVHDASYFEKVFEVLDINNHEVSFPILYVSTKDYKIKMIGEKK